MLRLGYLSVALLPDVVFAPLCVRQAHIGIEFQCLDLLPEKVDKLGMQFFGEVFHAAFPQVQLLRTLGEARETGMCSGEKRVAASFDTAHT
jgi:hypothetical protein